MYTPHQSEEGRTALLLRCPIREAELIRDAAKAERRTISGYILNAVLQRIAVREKTKEHFEEVFGRDSNPKAKAHSSGA